ncbi:MAG: NAD-dependent epimerase/dehydratase family protein [Opitutaceae bacterium]|nr:NAD-dependent epimerase/dehydratase family protein [Cytophagales bacterium]
MNILLTGATGFVGQNFINYFSTRKTNFHIFALSRESSQTNSGFITWLYNQTDFNKVLSDNDIYAVIHLAGKAHDIKNTSQAEEYFDVNYGITKNLFDAFANSQASKFIFLSSIKAVGDDQSYISNALDLSEPQTPYAKSKREAEKYIQNYVLSNGKSYYILRPTLIYGAGVKGNLATLIKFANKGLPYPFESFENKRSYLSVNNLSFIFIKLIENEYESMTLNIANEDAISTKELISIIYKALGKKPSSLSFPQGLIKTLAKMGDIIPLPINSEKLNKITSSFVVDTAEMIKKLGFSLPETTRGTISSITKK